ncbi:unnamed protein product [Urochloa decumbens]|uniref:Uncharacterized protein n=1 Tax=Urochloa decumbens TaxID=240449 RepID=A0ABC9B8G1_9POAL
MSHRRRLLNLVMGNKATGVCTLYHIDLHSPKNNLFYPTAAAAAAKDPSSSSTSLKKMKRIRPGEPRLSFQSMPPANSHLPGRWFDCAALSESKTVFLDYHSRGGSIYDDDARCVVTLPTLHASKWFPICLAAAGAAAGDKDPGGDDNIFVVGSGHSMYPAGDDANSRFQFQAMVHRKDWHPALSYVNKWRCDDLPPPPYVGDEGYRKTMIGSYGIVGAGLVFVSTEGIGTYCFDMPTRTWTKAGDWALPFSGKVEHLPELGVLVGFPTWEEDQRVCASPLPWTVSATVDGRRPELCKDSASLQPPYAWKRVMKQEPRLVSLGSGKLCAVQFFESKKDSCRSCGREDVDKRFAVFTGLEVVRAGEDDGGGNGKGGGSRSIRVVRHKSKRYMLPHDDDDLHNIFIKSVL